MSHRILVIDHHPQGLQRVVDPLRGAGYEVAVAQTVADGASTFGRFEPELVFIAARLPRTHGTVLCRELKRTAAGADTPIVLIVEGTGVQIDLPPLDQFGADRLIQKPVSADELLALCRELLDGEAGPASTAAVKTDDAPAAEPDDGLSIALEELDALDFDLPDEVLRKAKNAQPEPSTIQLSQDTGEDIEDHLDDLLSDKRTTAPTANPEPSTGRDHDADAAVIDQLDLEKELKKKKGAGDEPSVAQPTRSTAASRRTVVPRAPTATKTVSEPMPGSEQTAGRFQTEAFTRRDLPRPFPVAAEVRPAAGVARWSWVAVPLTMLIVFLAAFLMARPRDEPVDGLAATPPANDDSSPYSGPLAAGAPLGLPTDPREETDPPIETIRLVHGTAIEPEPEPKPEPEVQKVARNPSPPESRPDPRRVVPVEPETRDPGPQLAPPPLSEPEPVVEDVPAPPQPEAVVEATRPEPEPEFEPEPEQEQEPEVTLPIAPIVETVIPDPVEVDPEPQELLPEPVTRDAVLIKRVEPTVSRKDLRKGSGTVVLRVRVSESGTVTRVLVDRGIPGSPLEAAAVAAVLRWRYEPALDRDTAVESWATATFSFP